MKAFVSLLLGLVVGAFVVWVYRDSREKSPAQSFSEQVKDSTQSVRDTVADEWRDLKLRTQDITNEMTGTGQVIREKARAAGHAIADATADPRTTTTIKGKLMADSGLSSLNISVNTTDGVVTLSGTVASVDQVSRAMQIAMESEGVSKVISTLQAKTN